MYKVTIKGEAKTDYKNLGSLNGIDCQDNFTEYFDDYNKHYHSIKAKGLNGGYMDFRYENGKLWAYTVYHCNEELTKEELDDLVDYTQGQWSDGIGESFEQQPCFYDENDEEVYISPWFFGQKVTATQEKV